MILKCAALLHWLIVALLQFHISSVHEHGHCTDWQCLFVFSPREQKFVSERTDASSGAVASAGTNGRTPHTQEDVSLCLSQWLPEQLRAFRKGEKRKENCKKSWCPCIVEFACKCMVILFGEETSWLEPWLITLLICSSEYFWLVSFHVSFCCCCNFSLWKWCSAYVLSCLKEYFVKLKQKTLKTVNG